MFRVLEVSIRMIEELRAPIAPLQGRDRALYQQIRRAASSVALNIAEGNRRHGRDRRQFFRIAAGSVAETRTALRVAQAWGDLDAERIAPALSELEDVQRMLHPLTR